MLSHIGVVLKTTQAKVVLYLNGRVHLKLSLWEHGFEAAYFSIISLQNCIAVIVYVILRVHMFPLNFVYLKRICFPLVACIVLSPTLMLISKLIVRCQVNKEVLHINIYY